MQWGVPFGKGFHKHVAVLQLDHVTWPPFLRKGEVNGYTSRVSNCNLEKQVVSRQPHGRSEKAPGAGKKQCGQQPGRWPHFYSNEQATLQLFVLVSLQPTLLK